MKICSWNIRGLGARNKRVAVFDLLGNHNPDIVALHTIGRLTKKWVGANYHACYNTFARGVSFLFHQKLRYEEKSVDIDKEGRYIFIHCIIDNREWVVANVYIPPPFAPFVLLELYKFTLDKMGVPLIILGDFNAVMDTVRDVKKRSGGRGSYKYNSLSNIVTNFGWIDAWRELHKDKESFSYYSATHEVFSRLDMTFTNSVGFHLIKSIKYGIKGISDHSPVIIVVEDDRLLTPSLFKISPTWMELIGEKEWFAQELREFF